MYSENRKTFRMCVSTTKAFHNTPTCTATRVPCPSLWHLSETKDNHLRSQQTSNTDTLILSYRHILIKTKQSKRKNTLKHKTVAFLSNTLTHGTLPAGRSNAFFVGEHVLSAL